MRQCSQCKSVFIKIGGFEDQVSHEITRSNVMSEVGEELTSEWVVTDVVNETAAVRVGISNSQILGTCLRETLQEQRLDIVLPGQIHDVFVG